MSILATISDFKQGDYRFNVNDQIADSKIYYEDKISMLEKLWIKSIMGESLGSEFLSDPAETRWNLIKEPFVFCGGHCYGLKETLVPLIYSDLIKSDGVYSSQSTQKVASEVMQSVDIQANYSRAYNDGIKQMNLIRHKIIENNIDFPEFRLCELKKYILSLPF